MHQFTSCTSVIAGVQHRCPIQQQLRIVTSWRTSGNGLRYIGVSLNRNSNILLSCTSDEITIDPHADERSHVITFRRPSLAGEEGRDG